MDIGKQFSKNEDFHFGEPVYSAKPIDMTTDGHGSEYLVHWSSNNRWDINGMSLMKWNALSEGKHGL